MIRIPRPWALALALILLATNTASGADAKAPTVRLHGCSSERSIRATLLKHTPPGVSRDFVLDFARRSLRHEREVAVESVPAENRDLHLAVGVSSIRDVEVGFCRKMADLFLFKTSAYVSWAFDHEGKLIDVLVYKETDGL